MTPTSKRAFADALHDVAASVTMSLLKGQDAGLSREASVMGALIGILSIIRAEGMAEEALLKEARSAVPVRHQFEYLYSVRND